MHHEHYQMPENGGSASVPLPSPCPPELLTQVVQMLQARVDSLEADSVGRALQDFLKGWLQSWASFLEKVYEGAPRVARQAYQSFVQQLQGYLSGVTPAYALFGVAVAATPVALNRLTNQCVPVLNLWMVQGSAMAFGSIMMLRLLAKSTEDLHGASTRLLAAYRSSPRERQELIQKGLRVAAVGGGVVVVASVLLWARHQASTASALRVELAQTRADLTALENRHQLFAEARAQARGLATTLGLLPPLPTLTAPTASTSTASTTSCPPACEIGRA
eukprot:RCo024469